MQIVNKIILSVYHVEVLFGFDHYSRQYLSGFVVDSSGKLTNKCSLCPDGCSECLYDSNNCSSCFSGFGFIVNENDIPNGKCHGCSDKFCNNCGNDYRKCSSCNTGFGITLDGICQKCPANCKNCFYPEICYECEDGFERNLTIIDENYYSGCIQYPENCAKCDREYCQMCEEGYSFMVDKDGITHNNCVKCPNNCKQCSTDNTKCDECIQGFILNDDGKCDQCSEHCTECQRYDMCNRCKSGSIVQGFTCFKCPDHCNHCSIPYLYGTCDDGYSVSYKNDETYGQCISCPKNCKECDLETNKCLECNDGYVTIIKEDGSTDGKCVQCPRNCLMCSYNDSTQCIWCSENEANEV